MTNFNWKPHTPEVGAKSTVRFKKRPPAHQTQLHSQNAMRTRENRKKGSKGVKNEQNKRERQVTVLPLWSWQTKEQIACLRHGSEGQNWHRVPLSTVCMWTCWYAPSVPTWELERCTDPPFSLSSWFLLYSATLVSLVSSLYWVELTVIIPNSIIFINPTGLRTVHSLGVGSGQSCDQSP